MTRKVLTIAGLDPIAGAGVLADLKTLAAHGVYGVAAVTAVTEQNTATVRGRHDTSAHELRAQIETILEDVDVDAVKIGMLATVANVRVVADLMSSRPQPIVIDPVMRSSSGTALLDDAAVVELRDRLVPHATLVTPNIPEVQVLTDRSVTTVDDMIVAGRELCSTGCRAVLVKGGHAAFARGTDVLVTRDIGGDVSASVLEPEAPLAVDVHGTGCALSTAVAANLAGRDADTETVVEAVTRAKAYVYRAMQSACAIGRGKLILNHFVAP